MKISNTIKIAAAIGLLTPISMYAADSDVLAVAASTISSQLKGTGKALIFSLEGIAAVFTYWQTRNWVSLTGVGAIFVFTTALFAVI